MPKKDFTQLIQEDMSTVPTLNETREDGSERRRIQDTKRLKGARLIPIDRIRPDPDQPRKTFGKESLQDLVDSIREHGILQPIAVEYDEQEDYYKIINGERRWQAANEAGLKEIPCIERVVDEQTRLVHQLVENLQREDLNPIEEAEGYQTLVQRFGYTHEQLAQSVGKSRTVVTETLSLNNLPEDIKQDCRTSDNCSKSILLQVVRQPNYQKMSDVWEQVKTGGLTVREARTKSRRKGAPGRPKSFEFKYEPPDRGFTLRVRFRRTDVAKSEVVEALSKAIEEIQLSE